MNGGFRIAQDLRKLNKHISYKHFKLEIFKQSIRLVNKGDYLASVDPQHVYYSVEIAEVQQGHLCFKWEDIFFSSFLVFWMLLQRDYIFSSLMKSVFTTIREMGHTITSIFGVTLICSKSHAGCLHSLCHTADNLDRVGFCINEGKPVFKAIQCLYPSSPAKQSWGTPNLLLVWEQMQEQNIYAVDSRFIGASWKARMEKQYWTHVNRWT